VAFRGVSPRSMPAEEGPVACQDGNVKEEGCKSLCRWLGLTESTENGHCKDFIEKLNNVGREGDEANKGQGVYQEPTKWKFWRKTFWKASSMEPIIKVLRSNCKKEELSFYIVALKELMEQMEKGQHQKFEKYDDELAILKKKLEDTTSDLVDEELEKVKSQSEDYADDDTPLPACADDFHVEPGDVLTNEWGGPDFKEIAYLLTNEAMKGEALRLKKHSVYRWHFDYESTFNTSTDVSYSNRSRGDKVLRIFTLAWQHSANLAIKAGKFIGDVTINGGKLVWDIVANSGKILGKAGLFALHPLMRLYSKVKQTTPHTGDTRWTHTELAVYKDYTMSAVEPGGVRMMGAMCGSPGQIIVSRFVGDGTVDAKAYRDLAASRALFWQPYLSHYADTVGQWYRVVAGEFLPSFGNPGDSEYFEAVSQTKVKEMWDYVPTLYDSEEDFYNGLAANNEKNATNTSASNTSASNKTMNSKPKAMFCSKFAAAVWSSTIGNPTEVPNATARYRDLKIMFPMTPGATSPWELARWLLGKKGRKSWKSCLAPAKMAFHDRCRKPNPTPMPPTR